MFGIMFPRTEFSVQFGHRPVDGSPAPERRRGHVSPSRVVVPMAGGVGGVENVFAVARRGRVMQVSIMEFDYDAVKVDEIEAQMNSFMKHHDVQDVQVGRWEDQFVVLFFLPE